MTFAARCRGWLLPLGLLLGAAAWGAHPEIDIPGMRGRVSVVPLEGARLVLVGANGAWLWDGRSQRAIPLRRSGAWSDDSYGRLRAARIGDQVLVAGALQEHGGHGRESPTDLLAFDPAERRLPVSGNLSLWRASPTLTSLRDGAVLVVGGGSSDGRAAKSADLVRLKGNALQSEAVAEMHYPRSEHAAVLLGDGRVMVIGGEGAAASEVEIFDPATGHWSSTGRLQMARREAKATLLPDGSVLVVGGHDGRQQPVWGAERWDPATERWNAMPGLRFDRAYGAAVPIDNEQILFAGGAGTIETEIVNLRDYSSRLGPRLKAPRLNPALLRVGANEVQVIGGRGDSGYQEKVEILDVGAGPPVPPPALFLERVGPGVRLPSGRLLFAGGDSPEGGAIHAQLFDPEIGRPQALAAMPEPRFGHQVIGLADGSVLLLGGQAEAHAGTTVLTPALRWLPDNQWVTMPELTTRSIANAQDANGAARLLDGSVLFLETVPDPVLHTVHTQAWRWDPGKSRREPAGELRRARAGATVLTLIDGRVLVAGGRAAPEVIAADSRCGGCAERYVSYGTLREATTTEIYDPARRSWDAGPIALHEGGSALLLGDGRVVKWTRVADGVTASCKWEVADARATRWEPLHLPGDFAPGLVAAVGSRLVLFREQAADQALIWDTTTGRSRTWSTDLERTIRWTGVFTLDKRRLLVIGATVPPAQPASVYKVLEVP